MLVFFLKYSIIFFIICLLWVLLVCSSPDILEHDYPIKEKIFIALYLFMLYDSFFLFLCYEASVSFIEKNCI
jgi:hypothetical protein